MKVYKSKISIGPIAFLVILFAFIGYEIFSHPFNLLLAITVFIIPVLFIVYVFSSIQYTIDNQNLIVRAGFLVNESIAIPTIKKIEETSTWLSSPAASFDRLEVFYSKYGSVVISPKNKEQFIVDLLKINQNIEIKYKK